MKYTLEILFILFVVYFCNVSNADSPSVKFEISRTTSFNNIIPRKQCTYAEAMKCVEQNFRTHFCLMDKHQRGFLKITSEFIFSQYTGQYGHYFMTCIKESLRKFTTSNELLVHVDGEQLITPIFDKCEEGRYQPGSTKSNQTAEEIHHECIIDSMQRCFTDVPCFLKSHDKFLREIVPKCRNQALEHYNPLKFNSSSSIGYKNNGTKKSEDLTKMPLHQSLISPLTSLPKKIAEALGSLTFAHFEAIKFVLLNGFFRTELCNPSSIIELHEEFPFKETLQDPWITNTQFMKYIPENFRILLKNFTMEQYIAVKNASDTVPFIRSIICAPEYVVIASRNITTMQPQPHQYNMPYILDICRHTVASDSQAHMKVCSTPRMSPSPLFG